MSIWQSLPFVAGGSLMWEFIMENEPAGINDFATTTIGGVGLGEMAFRLSDHLIDERAHGFERLRREAMITLISPIRGLRRIASGEAWKHARARGNVLPPSSVRGNVSLGFRSMAGLSPEWTDIDRTLCYNVNLYYGNPFDEENETPYDFFKLEFSGNLYPSTLLVSRVNALGPIFSRSMSHSETNSKLTWGLFQHFNFYQSSGAAFKPYKLAEAASLGPGLLGEIHLLTDLHCTVSAHLSGILLGGNQTDHYTYDRRNYNMGSGYSFKLGGELRFADKAVFYARRENYSLYAWKGYAGNETGNISTDVQGDAGRAKTAITSLGLDILPVRKFLFTVEVFKLHRKSIYRDYPGVKHRVNELRLSVGRIF
jgi:hypothetical protein